VVGADELAADEWEKLERDLAAHSDGAKVIGCRLVPEPAQPLPAGTRAAVFVTARADSEPSIRARLAEQGVAVAVFSPNLARRAALSRDVQRAASEGCDLFLTELKAAAIDVVAENALRFDVPLVFLRNRPCSIEGGPDLDEELLRLAGQARGARAPVSRSAVGL
jgi:cyclic 2,3-diphosphoglycerate synthetase